MPDDNSIAAQLEQTLSALREREQDFNSLLDNAQDFVIYRVAIDPDHPYGGRVVLVSPSIKDILGIADPYHFETWFERLHPDDAPTVIAANRRSWQEGVPYNQATRIYHPAKQAWLWVHTMSRPVFDAQGRLTHFNGLILDVTEQKRAEAALEEARRTLEERVEIRTREIERRRQIAESLRDILRAINSNLPLPEVLDCIVTQATRHMGAAACVLSRLDTVNQQVVHEAMYGWPADLQSYNVIPLERLPQAGGAEYRQALERHEPTYGNYGPLPDRLDEIRNDPTLSEEERARRLLIRTHFAGSMEVPLVTGEQLYGGLAFYYAEPQTFSDEQVQLAMTFAEQAALALENARLRVEVEQAAVAAERNRIARELHDSVSQALYGIALGTRTARTLVDRQPVEDQVKATLANPLDYVLSLAEAGLAEMRALIFELRPDALEKEGLVAALTKQAEAIRARHKLDMHTDFCSELPDLPLATKEALYRVAQEALNNLIKHAEARRVVLRLRCVPGILTLEVQDDGVGFDPQADYPGHLGLHTMRERVERLGGGLAIESAPGAGTTVQATFPLP